MAARIPGSAWRAGQNGTLAFFYTEDFPLVPRNFTLEAEQRPAVAPPPWAPGSRWRAGLHSWLPGATWRAGHFYFIFSPFFSAVCTLEMFDSHPGMHLTTLSPPPTPLGVWFEHVGVASQLGFAV